MRNGWFTKRIIGREVFMTRVLFNTVLALILVVSAFAKMYETPRSFSLNDKSQDQADRKILPNIDTERLLAEDLARRKDPQHPAPQRFAVAVNSSYSLTNSGTWQTLADGRLWLLRLQSPGAKSLNLGITRFDMPQGAKLWIYDPAHTQVEGPYTASHRSRLGSLWTPVIEGEEMVVEVFVPTGVAQPVIEIGTVNQGYASLGKSGLFGTSEGTCENDVVCSVGDPWRNQIRAVGLYSVSGTTACTGNLLNDTASDLKPYILSANHCGVDSTNDASIVFYWNFQSPTCGTHGPGSLADNQTGATYHASYAPSDFLLFELSTTPDPSYNVYYAGWDATGSAPPSSVGIHQPETDVKAISFSSTPAQSADYEGALDPAGNHWLIDWSSGVTEEGSSGSCIFNTTNQLCVGQLHGGPSACGATPANLHDYYGKLSVSWNGGGTPATRLKDWLDPLNTGALTNDGDPHITTANGIHYNFQGAGEYVSLRNADGLEIQTRQAPIATTFVPGADPYDGVATCVSLNTAVAARVAGHRVTYEPNLSGVPDPSGLQLRLDGVLTSLGAAPQSLGSGARMLRTAAPGGLEIDFPDNNVLLATPGWWASQSKWYLDVDVVRAPTNYGAGGAGVAVPKALVSGALSEGGIMAAIPPGNWLPSLPDGTSMGPMPASLHDRYVGLYQTFGDAWRVTGGASLFDYAPGASTGTFTVPTWPAENGSCTIPGVIPVQPADPAVAERACRDITGKYSHADCVFDVTVTGNPGFARTYGAGQGVIATATGGTGQTGTPGQPGGTPPPGKGKLAMFLDLGAGIPNGTFSNGFKTGISFNAGLEYLVNSYVSAEGIFGYHRFPGKLSGDQGIYQFSANAKVYLVAPSSKVRPFLNGGIGDYLFSPGSSKFGANFGGGILYRITGRFGLQGSYDFHNVSTPGAATRFSTLQGGIRLVF
jgi:hypothetical protein